MCRMRRRWLIFALCLLCAPARVSADPYAGFRIPEHGFLDWTVSASGSGSWYASSRAFAERLRQHSLSGFGQSRLHAFSERDLSSLRFQGYMDGFGSTLRTTSTSPGTPAFGNPARESERHDDQDRESANSSVDGDWYGAGVPWLAGVGLRLDFLRDRFETSDRNRTDYGDTLQSVITQSSDRFVERLHGGVAIELRGGIGRVRDATGLLEAAIFEARLRGGGWLDRPLSPAARQALANLMYLRSDVGAVREQPARETWAAIDRILVEDGFDPLPPQAVLRLQDATYSRGASAQGLPVSPIRRTSGQHALIEYVESHSQSRVEDGFRHVSRIEQSGMVISESEYLDDSRSITKGTERTLGLSVEWHRALDHRTQVDARGSVVAAVKGDDLKALYRGAIGCSYFIADRWLVTSNAFHEWLDRDRTSGPTARDQSQTLVNLHARYFLENRVSVAVGVSHRDRWIREFYGTSAAGNFHDWTTAFTFQFDYRLMGLLSAPGFEISREAPPAATTPL